MKKRKNEKIEKAKKRSIVYSLRVTESQYEAVTAMAKELRMPVSTYVKELLFNKNFRITESIAVHDPALERLSEKLEKIGKRLNHIMRNFNQGGQSTPEIENEIRDIIAEMKEAFKEFEASVDRPPFGMTFELKGETRERIIEFLREQGLWDYPNN